MTETQSLRQVIAQTSKAVRTGPIELRRAAEVAETNAKERDEWREEAWRCYVESGADSDGADARHLNPGEAIRAVRELRADYDAACDELAQLKQSVETLREAVEDTLCDDEPCSRCDHLRRALASLDEQEAE